VFSDSVSQRPYTTIFLNSLLFWKIEIIKHRQLVDTVFVCWPTVLSVAPLVQHVVCLSSVTFCIQAKRLDRFVRNFQRKCGLTMGPPDYILGQFEETVRCRDINFFVSNITRNGLFWQNDWTDLHEFFREGVE